MKNFGKNLLLVIITAAIVGGGVYYYLNKKSDQDKQNLNNQIEDLRQQTTGSSISDENPEGPSIDQEAISWKTYKNGSYGFTLQYPATWTIEEGVVENGDKSVVALNNPATDRADDFAVYYYLSVTEESENQAQNLGAKTIDELVSKDDSITKIGSMKLGGLPATDVYWKTTNSNYVILAMSQDHLFKIWLGGSENKESLTEIDKKIIASFQFTE